MKAATFRQGCVTDGGRRCKFEAFQTEIVWIRTAGWLVRLSLLFRILPLG
jgi:hypothetical protein